MSSVHQFIDKLDENIMELGLDSRFKENPAYKKVLFEVESLIMEMNMMENIDNVFVRKEDNAFNFEWKNPITKENHSFKLWISNDKDELFCSEIIESVKKSEEKDYKEKFVVTLGSHIDSNRNIEIIKKYGSADNLNCEYGCCNTLCGAEKKKYDKYGVQESVEVETFNPSVIHGDVTNIDPMAIVAITRQAFNSDYWKQRTVARREKLDVVSVTYEDKSTGEKFIGKQEINQEHGLQDLSYETYHFADHVVIHPLMSAEIEEMLSKEDPKVAEGLRRYVEGRDRFSYDSENSKECLYRTSQR